MILCLSPNSLSILTYIVIEVFQKAVEGLTIVVDLSVQLHKPPEVPGSLGTKVQLRRR
jgi:hypothetical protein